MNTVPVFGRPEQLPVLSAARLSVNAGRDPSLRVATASEPKLSRAMIEFLKKQEAALQDDVREAEHALSVARAKLSNGREQVIMLSLRHDAHRNAVAEASAAVVSLDQKLGSLGKRIERAHKAVERSLAPGNAKFADYATSAAAGGELSGLLFSREKIERHLESARETLAAAEKTLADFETTHGRDLEQVANPFYDPASKGPTPAPMPSGSV